MKHKLIVIDKLTKRYAGSDIAAVDALSLSVGAGEVYGFLGSNGAGKSTTIRMLLNFLQPTSGSAQILGKDSVREHADIARSVGYLAGDVALYERVTGAELLDYLGKLSGNYDKKYLATLAKRFEAQLDKPIRELSKGNRQKIGLLQACINLPQILILDEPTSGLDPVMQERFYETIHEAKARGAAIFLSSHSLSEVEKICDRVAIIRNGKLVRDGALAEFIERTPVFKVTFAQKPKGLASNKAVTIIQSNDTTVTIKPTGDIASTLAALSKYNITSFEATNQELEEEFMSYYGAESESTS